MNVLITGVSCAGKSTIARHLLGLGFNAYDTDCIKNLSAWTDIKTGECINDVQWSSSDEWEGKYDWLWNKEYLKTMLDNTKSNIAFFCGSSSNQALFYDYFNLIFLLEVDDDLIIERLKTQREHSFGSNPGELEIILNWYKDFQEKTKKAGAIVLDAKNTTLEIVDEILHIVN